MDNFIEAVTHYDKIIRTIDIPDKTYDDLPLILGKIFGIGLWTYGVYKGLREGDMGKIAMATVAGFSFGASVAVTSKIVQEGYSFFRWLYKLHIQERIILDLAQNIQLHSSDLTFLDTQEYTEQTRTMLLELQLQLPN